MNQYLKNFKLLGKALNVNKNFNRLLKYNVSISNTEQTKTNGKFYINVDAINTHVHNSKSYANTIVPDVPLISGTIGQKLEESAILRPNDLAYSFPHNRGLQLTFQEAKQRADLLAQNLLKMGFQKGDRIAFILPNTHELVVGLLAASSIGLINVIMNPGYQLVEIEYMLKKTGAKGAVFYDSFKTLQHYEIIKKVCPELDSSKPGELNSARLPDLKHVIVLNSPLIDAKPEYKGTWSYKSIAEKPLTNTNVELPHVDSDDPCFILFTSGTTGFPKGALIKHSGIVNVLHIFNRIPLPVGWEQRCIPIPLFHVFGLGCGLVAPLIEGQQSVFPFYLPDTLFTMKAIQAYKCESLLGAPTILIDLLNHPERKNLNLSSLKNVLMGASTVPYDLIKKLKSDVGIKHVIIGYGMTETSMGQCFTTYKDVEKSEKHAYQTIGRPFPHTEAKIIDSSTNKIVDLNVDGELCLRGFNIIDEYWDDPKKSQESIDKNGWLKTGDLCSMDKDGYITFKSRSKELIIRGGVNIYPAEVETFLRTHPKVVDVNVIGVPDERFGEEVFVWVKLKPNMTITIDEIKEFCKGNIAVFKIPKYMKVTDAFPINANGKILKGKLVEMAKAELKL